MAPHDANPAVQASRLRVADLAATGAVVTGVGHGYVSGGLIQLQSTPDIDQGTAIDVTLADGTKCVDVPGVPVVRWLNLELTICGVEDELFELIENALLIQTAGTTIGHADPALGVVSNPNGVSLELWSKMMLGGSQDPTFPWYRHLFPRTYQWVKGQQTWLNGHLGWVFNGKAIENAGMRATGPFTDWTDPASVTRVRAGYRTAVDPPAASVGYIAVP